MSKKITKFIIGKDYNYNDIRESLDDIAFMDEHGTECIGEHLLVFHMNDSDDIMSFIYSGYSDTYGGIFKLIHADNL